MITLKPIQGTYIGHLVGILNNDSTLGEQLSSNTDPITPEQFTDRNAEWAKRTNSEMYAIVLEDEAIGMISLSHIDMANRTAQIGYWLASTYWNNGYTSAAFGNMLTKARQAGIASVSATIDTKSEASKAIWLKSGATFAEDHGKIKASLRL